MKVTLKGQELALRSLSDSEYLEAIRFARMSGTPLSECITCGAKETDIPESGGVKEFISGVYAYKGKTYPCDCQAQMALRARYLVANIGAQYMTLDWEDFDGSKEAADLVEIYLTKWKACRRQGMGLEFHGPQGVGKTFAATHVGKELIKWSQSVFFISFTEMVSAFETDDPQRFTKRLRESTYLILDEVLPAFSDRQRHFLSSQFEALIRHRTNHNLPTIITTNMSQEELNEMYPRTYSLLQAKQMRVDMSGEDARLKRIPMQNLEIVANDEVAPIT